MSSRVEQILNGETVKPQSRVEELLEDLVDLADNPISYNDLTDRTHYEYDNVLSKGSVTIGQRLDSWGYPVSTAYLGYVICDRSKDIKIPEGKRVYVRFGDLKFEITELPSEAFTTVDLVTFDDGYSLKYRLTNIEYEGANGDRRFLYLQVTAYETVESRHSKYAGTVLSIEIVEPVVMPLDEKYIPDTIARVSDIPTVPDPVTDDHINSLIDAKLGVIENGTY